MPDLKKPTRLFLVRHGEVVQQGQGKFLGFTDLDLSPRGKEQVMGLAEYLKGVSLDQAYASDLKRAMDSARIICQGREIEPRLLSGLTGDGHGGLGWKVLGGDQGKESENKTIDIL